MIKVDYKKVCEVFLHDFHLEKEIKVADGYLTTEIICLV